MPEDKTIQPITDDAELAKVLDGMKDNSGNGGGLNFEETSQPGDDGTNQPNPDDNATDQPVADQPAPDQPAEAPALPAVEQPLTVPPMPPSVPGVSSDLDAIKKSALEELRPLVDKLELPADEKFDTLLLIIRSTDDQSLVSQAYETAKSIENEAKRAEALLDIIKEIDYFANPQQPQA